MSKFNQIQKQDVENISDELCIDGIAEESRTHKSCGDKYIPYPKVFSIPRGFYIKKQRICTATVKNKCNFYKSY